MGRNGQVSKVREERNKKIEQLENELAQQEIEAEQREEGKKPTIPELLELIFDNEIETEKVFILFKRLFNNEGIKTILTNEDFEVDKNFRLSLCEKKVFSFMSCLAMLIGMIVILTEYFS